MLICVLMDSHGRPLCADGHRRRQTDSHGRPVCAGGHPRTSCVYWTDSPRGPKSPEQSTGRVSVLSPRTNMLICVLMDSHGRPASADGHTRKHTDSHRRLVCADGHTRTSCLCSRTPTDVLCVLTDTHGHTRTATDVLSVLTDSHRRPVCAGGHPQTSCVY